MTSSESFQHADQGGVESARRVTFGRGNELVLESEAVQEGAQARVVVGPEALVRTKRVGYPGQRLAQMLGQHVPIRHVLGHLPQAVHVVAEREQAGRKAGEFGEGAPDPARARNFAERAYMRQAGPWPVSNKAMVRAGHGESVPDLHGFLEGPRPGRSGAQSRVTGCIRHPEQARKRGCLGQSTYPSATVFRTPRTRSRRPHRPSSPGIPLPAC